MNLVVKPHLGVAYLTLSRSDSESWFKLLRREPYSPENMTAFLQAALYRSGLNRPLVTVDESMGFLLEKDGTVPILRVYRRDPKSPAFCLVTDYRYQASKPGRPRAIATLLFGKLDTPVGPRE